MLVHPARSTQAFEYPPSCPTLQLGSHGVITILTPCQPPPYGPLMLHSFLGSPRFVNTDALKVRMPLTCGWMVKIGLNPLVKAKLRQKP